MTTKRFWAALVLLALILTLCSLATWDLRQGLDALENALGQMRQTPPEAQDSLVDQAQTLLELWNDKENRFVLYINHDTLDHITQMVAELPALARFEESSHLYSHLDAITALLDDLWQSSLPGYKTLL